jgi:hypothetical protein
MNHREINQREDLEVQICWDLEKKDILAKCPLYRKPLKIANPYRYQRNGKPVVWTKEQIATFNNMKGLKSAKSL